MLPGDADRRMDPEPSGLDAARDLAEVLVGVLFEDGACTPGGQAGMPAARETGAPQTSPGRRPPAGEIAWGGAPAAPSPGSDADLLLLLLLLRWNLGPPPR